MERPRAPRTHKLAVAALVGAALGLATAVIAWVRPSVIERGELWTYDLRARAAADRAAASGDIVLVDISEQDLEDAENHLDVTWPWPRAMYGYLTSYCQRAGAKVVVFDWLFQDRGQYSVGDAEEFAQAMRDAGNVVIGLAFTRAPMVVRATDGTWAAPLPGAFATRAEAEQAAIQLLAWNARVFVIGAGPFAVLYGGKREAADVVAAWRRMSAAEELAALFAGTAPADGGEPAPAPEPTPRELTADELGHELTAAALIEARDGLEVADGEVAIERRAGLDPPLAVIAAGPRRGGNVYQDYEADGILRRHTPLVRHRGKAFPSLALAAYLVGHPDVTPRIAGRTLVLGDRRMPLDDDARIGLRFHGAHVYPRLSSYDLLQSLALLDEGKPPTVPLDRLKDKYVIVSATGQALRDVRATPVSRVMLGAEIQATALDNLLTGAAIRRASRSTDAGLGFALCLAVAMAVLAVWLAINRTLLALLATAATAALALAGYWLAARWLFDRQGLWIAVATPALGAALSSFAVVLVTSSNERRSRRFVQEALGRYTSPALVRELIEHPEHLSLEWGERRQMTVYFSDIAGFTTISEKLTPEKLVTLLNDYLTSMTDLVLAHGGVVDKYIGDAVMAFWGAPIPAPDHAAAAVRCAIAMRKRCVELQPTWEAEYGVHLTARAGLSSGECVVGNMGSRHKYNYTVMGDMVNLASRLEGANKTYGTHLMISESTRAAIGDGFATRELDLIAVKGKERPVRVFEVLGLAGDVDPAAVARAEAFAAALARYRDRDFAGALAGFEAIVSVAPDDGPSKAYVERCRWFLDHPPEPWDGVWHMKEK
jgi:adenylate cyclase